MLSENDGQAVLQRAVEIAERLWGGRLLAAYALGSLAHGGFSPLVSDVDLGLVIEDPLAEGDASVVARLSAEVAGSGLPLADRLSVFWASPSVLAVGGDSQGTRFPPLDRLDLIRHGQLLRGRDLRSAVRAPEQQELVLAAAAMGLGLLDRPAYQEALANPASLVAAGAKPLTKAILFPVRFLYTARTGEIGRNHDAANHFAAHETGPQAELAAAALRWREAPPPPDDAAAIALVGAGLRSIYVTFLADHAPRARDYGQPELAERLEAAHRALEA